MNIAQRPTPEQIQQLLQGAPDTPVVMVNLLSFKAEADGDNKGLSGLQAYARYGTKMREFIETRGARVLWSGRVDSMVIGESDAEFQMIALVEYPSRAAFIEIASNPEVAEFAKDRTSGLEGQWLIATTELGGLGADEEAP
jgi:uncharacterized protein (DUF1330 family)